MKIPKTLFRVMGGDVEVDVAQRILERALFVTRSIAADGGIVDPAGINVRFFGENPVVLAKHSGPWEEARSMVIGRSLGLTPSESGMESRTQFANTDLGREYAYLYGVNAEKEVYARGWSFSWRTDESETWTIEHAQEWLGKDWDEDLVPPWVLRQGEVWIALKSMMHEYSAVELGADKKALSRAYKDKGIRLAGEYLAMIDLREAGSELAELKKRQTETASQVGKLEEQILALSRDGAAAAERGDTAEILAEVRKLQELVGEREVLTEIRSLTTEVKANERGNQESA